MQLDNHPFGPDLQNIASLASIHVTLDLPLCVRAFELYLNPNQLSPAEIAETLGVSERKLRAIREWLNLLGFVQTDRSRNRTVPTPDADLFLAIAETDLDSFLELAYFNLCSRNQLVAGLVNVFLADQLVYSIAPSFLRADALNWFLEFFTRSENDLKECFNRFFSPLLRSDGFGPLGLLEDDEVEKRIRINSHEPHPYVFAYVLGQMAAGRPSVPLDEVIAGFNSPGRIFFLGRQQVLATLVHLDREGLVQLDLTAGLNQVGLGGQVEGRAILARLGGVDG